LRLRLARRSRRRYDRREALTKGRNKPDAPTEDTNWREGERYYETTGEEPFDEEEELDPEEAERHIARFMTSAEELTGSLVAELAARVDALMREASRDLETIMEGKPHNKVLATQLLLGQRARAMPPEEEPERRRLSAASTLLSEIVIRGAKN
jgi:hypothetical protein